MNNSRLVKKQPKAKSFLCLKCSKGFSTKFSMQRHFRECGVEAIRVECEKCKKSLKNTDILEKHQLVCFGLTKKLLCSLCDEFFCSPFSLRRHMLRYHRDEEWPAEMFQTGENSRKEKPMKSKNDNNIPESDTKDKKILNFAIAKAAGEEKSDFRYYMDVVCCDYEYLEDEEETSIHHKPVIYPLPKSKKEISQNSAAKRNL